MKVRPGYKQTEVGVIPEDWSVAALDTLTVIERGKFSARPRNDPKYYGGEYPFLQTGDITRSGGRISSFTQALNTQALSVSRLFPHGTLFFTIAANIGDVGISTFEAACPDSLVAISPRGQTEKRWLLYELASRKEEFEALASPGAQLNVNLEKLRPFLLPVPTPDEQRAIATTLSDMDAEITALETRRTKTRALKQAMMQELLTGRTRLVKPGEKPIEEAVAQTEGRKANVHFLRSVLAAEIIDQLHDQPTFGHVKFEKMMFLVEHLCEVDTGSTYHRKAAGPYDNRALRSIDSQLQKQQWFEARKEDGRFRYIPMAKRGGHKPYFNRHFSGIGETLEKILTTFKTAKTEQCEIVATLLAAWSDLLCEKEAVSDEMIVHEVLNNWHESKQRIPEDRWLRALDWMREKGFVPKGVTPP
jgi:hypothetical protein